MHITCFAQVEVAQSALVDDLASWTNDELLARLFREDLFEELQFEVKIMGWLVN